MKLTFLGTGAAIPTKNRAHSSMGLKYNGEVFLFDCGENTQRQIIFTDISPMKIDNIFISHLHGDHILGLPGLLQSIAFQGRKEPINIYGPVETKDTVENILKIGYHSVDYEINVHELSSKNPEKIIDNENYGVYSYPVSHSVPSLGYVFREKKKPRLDMKKAIELGVNIGPDLKKLKSGIPVKSKDGNLIHPEDVLLPPKEGICVGYSGDTLPLEDFGEFLKELGCSILVHEATFDSTKKNNAIETMHSTVEDAFNVAQIANVKTLILTHISARYDDDISPYLNEINDITKRNNNLDIEILVAEDLMEYPLKQGRSKN